MLIFFFTKLDEFLNSFPQKKIASFSLMIATLLSINGETSIKKKKTFVLKHSIEVKIKVFVI